MAVLHYHHYSNRSFDGHVCLQQLYYNCAHHDDYLRCIAWSIYMWHDLLQCLGDMRQWSLCGWRFVRGGTNRYSDSSYSTNEQWRRDCYSDSIGHHNCRLHCPCLHERHHRHLRSAPGRRSQRRCYRWNCYRGCCGCIPVDPAMCLSVHSWYIGWPPRAPWSATPTTHGDHLCRGTHFSPLPWRRGTSPQTDVVRYTTISSSPDGW